MLKKILWICLAVFVCIVVIVAWVIAHSFNAQAVQNQFVAALQDMTGREIAVGGAPELKWQPIPTLTLKDMTVSNVTDSKIPNMLTIIEVQIQITWTSLFSNPVRIKIVILKNPELLIERLSASNINLQFSKLFKHKMELETQNLLGEYQKRTAIDIIEIEDGTVNYVDDRTPTTFAMDKIQGAINLDSVNGPMIFAGKGTWAGIELNMSAQLDELQMSQPLTFSGRISEQTSQSTLEFSGKIVQDVAVEKYMDIDGMASVGQPNTLLKLLKWPEFPKSRNEAILANFKVGIAPSEIMWDNLTMRLGPPEQAIALNAEWKYFIFHKKLDGKVTTTSPIDWNEWSPFFKNLNLMDKRNKFTSTNWIADIQSLIVNRQKIEDIHFEGKYENEQLSLQKLTGVLPGGTMMLVNGKIQLAPKLLIDGNIDLRTDNAQDLLSFLQVPHFDGIAEKALRQKGVMSGHIIFAKDEIKFDVSRFELDQTQGSILFEKNEQGDTNVKLDLDGVNLDKYISLFLSENVQSIADEFYKWEQQIEAMKKPEHPIAWSATVKNLVWHRLPVQSLKAQGVIAPLEMTAQINMQDVATANMDLTVKLINTGEKSWFLDSSALVFSAGNFETFLKRAGWTTGSVFWDKTQQLSAEIGISGQAKEWLAKGALKRQNLNVSFDGQVTNEGLKDMTVNLAHPDFRGFMYAVDDNFSGFSKLTGALKFSGELTGNAQNLQANDMTLDIGNQKFKGNWYYERNNRIIKAELTTPILDVAKFLPDIAPIYNSVAGFSDQNLPVEKLSPWTVNLRLNADQTYYKSFDLRNVEFVGELKDKKFSVPNFRAQWAKESESKIAISGQYAWNEEIPTLSADIKVQRLSLRPDALMLDNIGLTKGILSLEGKLNFEGFSPAEMVKNSSGQGVLSLTDPVWIGADMTAAQNVVDKAKNYKESVDVFEPALMQALSKGKSVVSSAKADFTLDKGIMKVVDGDAFFPQARVPAWNLKYDLSSRKVQAQMSVLLEQNMPQILYTLDNHKNLIYDVDSKQFVKALESEIVNIQKQEEARKLQEIQELNLATLKTKQAEAKEMADRLKQHLNKVEKLVWTTPDERAGTLLKEAQTIFEKNGAVAEQEGNTVAGYIQAMQQMENAQGILIEAEKVIFAKKLVYYQSKTAENLVAISGHIDEITQFYQQKRYLDILASIIQGCKEQQAIVQRASEQLRRHLTPEQADKVYSIIENATQKVEMAYRYASDLYTEKQQAPQTGVIIIEGQDE